MRLPLAPARGAGLHRLICGSIKSGGVGPAGREVVCYETCMVFRLGVHDCEPTVLYTEHASCCLVVQHNTILKGRSAPSFRFQALCRTSSVNRSPPSMFNDGCHSLSALSQRARNECHAIFNPLHSGAGERRGGPLHQLLPGRVSAAGANHRPCAAPRQLCDSRNSSIKSAPASLLSHADDCFAKLRIGEWNTSTP